MPSVFENRIVSLFLGDRGRQLRRRAGLSGVIASELADGDLAKQSISIDGDDHVLVFMDKAQRRLLIEGISAR